MDLIVLLLGVMFIGFFTFGIAGIMIGAAIRDVVLVLMSKTKSLEEPLTY